MWSNNGGGNINKIQLNNMAVNLVMQAFIDQGFNIEKTTIPAAEVDFIAVSTDGKLYLKIKVRAISQIGSYIFCLKKRFNIEDPHLYMAVIYLPGKEEKEIYLIPANEWGTNTYPFKGKDYNKPGQSSQPEWGISFSMKAKDAMENYRFIKIINQLSN